MEEECTCRVGFEEVVDEGDYGYYCGGWGEEGESGETFDEGCYRCGRDVVCGREERVEVPEKAAPVFTVQQRGGQEVVQTGVELGIVQVAGCYEGEETCERGDREGQVWIVDTVGEEVHENLRTSQGGEDRGIL